MVLNKGRRALNPGMWLFICESFHLDPRQHLQQQDVSHRNAEVTMNGFCFFCIYFRVPNSVIYLHFLLFSSEKLRYFLLYHIFSSPQFSRWGRRKEKSLKREESSFPLLSSYFVTYLLFVGASLCPHYIGASSPQRVGWGERQSFCIYVRGTTGLSFLSGNRNSKLKLHWQVRFLGNICYGFSFEISQ